MATEYKPMTLFTRIVFWFVGINALAGGLSLMVLPGQTERFFFWTIQPPINAALFGALYFGGAMAVGWAAWQGKWEPARYLVPVLVSAGILISATTLLHVDRFAAGFRLFYWLLIYVGAPLLALVIYFVQERAGAMWAAVEPLRWPTRALAVGVGGLLVLFGLVVLIVPGPVVAAWPWQTSPLMVRIFVAWFSAFGVGLLWFGVERDWTRLRPIANLMIAAAALDLLMVAVHWSELGELDLNLVVYCFHLVALAGLGAVMHLLQIRSRQPAVA